MIKKQRIITAAATFVIAGSAGYLMQNGDALAARFTAEPEVTASDPTGGLAAANNGTAEQLGLPVLPTDAVTPFGFEAIMVERPAPVLVAAFNGGTLTDFPAPMFYAQTCDVTLNALPAPGAMVTLSLDASCYQNQRIEISHAGLIFADTTLPDGSYIVQIPALQEYEPFKVAFADGRDVEAKTLMLTVDGYDRVAVNWTGEHNLHIHALEQGAEFGQAGHVWAEAANDPADGVDANGGFLIELGNPDILHPKMAEVYSYPSGRGSATTDVELIVEAEINTQTCGTQLSGTAVQVSSTGASRSSTLSLSFPACDGENGYLVLKNLLQDLKIARN